MSRAETCTLLSLDRFARIVGLNPVHFSGAAGADPNPFPLRGSCSDVWWQRSYMGADKVSREDLALAIANAEEDITKYLGYSPGPTWTSKEMQMFPRHHRRELFDGGFNSRFDGKSLKLNRGHIISPGRRATTLIFSASVLGGSMVWSDPDLDTFDERMTVTVPTTLTSLSRQQIKVYFYGHSSECAWEIRQPRSVVIAGGNIVIEFDFWQMIDPDQQDPYPLTTNPVALNVADATIYVDRCNVYREFTDYSQHAVEFYWEPRSSAFPCPHCGGATCEACAMTVQCGCMHIRDVDLGFVVPAPATWDSANGTWAASSWTRCEPPDQVKMWYYSGELSEGFLAGNDLDPLSRWWAETIAWLAVARLERNFCACGNLTALATDLRSEYARSDANGPTWFLTERQSDNPFGTRKGEMMAWRRVSKLGQRIPQVAVI